MKRFHVHAHVQDLAASIAFYSKLFDAQARAEAADLVSRDEGETTCCYARSEKHWVTDPQGIAWEQFHTLADIPVFSQATAAPEPKAAACCAPRGKPVGVPVKSASSCC